MIEAAERLVPETAEWIAKKDGNRMRLYAIKDGTVHELSAECKPPRDPNLDDAGTAECEYGVLRPLIGTEIFTCRVERTKRRGDMPIETRTSWCFKLDKWIVIEYEAGAADADAERAEDFARALVDAILAAPIAI